MGDSTRPLRCCRALLVPADDVEPAGPVVEPRRPQPCCRARQERSVVELRAVVGRAGGGFERSRVVLRAQELFDKRGEPHRFGASSFHGELAGAGWRCWNSGAMSWAAMGWTARVRSARRRRKWRRRRPTASVRTTGWSAGSCRECLLLGRALPERPRAQVPAVNQPVGSDDRQRDMVRHAGAGLDARQVATGRHEVVQHGIVVERRGVGGVDDDFGAVEGGGQADPRDRVDTGGRGGGKTSWPQCWSSRTSFPPMSPVPPITTMRMVTTSGAGAGRCRGGRPCDRRDRSSSMHAVLTV